MPYQRRFVAYAKAHGRTPEEMIEHDRAAYPGGVMCGFILWVAERKREFAQRMGWADADACAAWHREALCEFIDTYEDQKTALPGPSSKAG